MAGFKKLKFPKSPALPSVPPLKGASLKPANLGSSTPFQAMGKLNEMNKAPGSLIKPPMPVKIPAMPMPGIPGVQSSQMPASTLTNVGKQRSPAQERFLHTRKFLG